VETNTTTQCLVPVMNLNTKGLITNMFGKKSVDNKKHPFRGKDSRKPKHYKRERIRVEKLVNDEFANDENEYLGDWYDDVQMGEF